MDQDTYEQDRAVLVAKLEKAQAEAKELQAALAGFDSAYKLLKRRTARKETKARAAKVIRGLALSMQGDFGVKEITAVLEGEHPHVSAARSTVSGVLSEMTEANEIELIQRGSGRSPSRYRVREEVSDDPLRFTG